MREEDWGVTVIDADVIGPKAMIARGMEICDRIMQLLLKVDEGCLDIQDETWV